MAYADEEEKKEQEQALGEELKSRIVAAINRELSPIVAQRRRVDGGMYSRPDPGGGTYTRPD